ncbi:CsbD family protein [Kitasatospora sp. NPDC001132]
MSASDKASNLGDKVKGKVKETAGKAVRNERLEVEGKGDQTKGDVKQDARRSRTPSRVDRATRWREGLDTSGEGLLSIRAVLVVVRAFTRADHTARPGWRTAVAVGGLARRPLWLDGAGFFRLRARRGWGGMAEGVPCA